jgi:hypothetical protein
MEYSQPELQAALLCEGITTDEAGRHNIINEFSQHTMGYSQQFTVLTIWRGNGKAAAQQYSEKTEIIAPDGRIVATGMNGPFSLHDRTYRQVNSLLLENVDFTHDGLYELRITLKSEDEHIAVTKQYPILVV